VQESRGRLIGRGIAIGLCAVACVVALSLHAERVAAAGYIVNMTSDSGPGSLRDAITQVNTSTDPGNTITFSVTGTITLTSALPAINKPVAITGPTSGAGVTVSGGNAVQVFVVNSGVTASISNLTIANGGAFSGGGIANNGTLTVTNSTLSGNRASIGGGGIENGGTLTVANSTLSGNGANDGGGGIVNQVGSTLTVTNSTLSGNNTATRGVGGGIENSGTLTVTTSTFTSNGAFFGGGISNGGTLTVTNSTFSGNGAFRGGGGGISNEGTLTVTNSTLTGNGSDGGGVGGGISNGNGRTLNLTNTIVAGNTATIGSDLGGTPAATTSHNLIGSTPPPLLAPLGSYGGPTQTIALLPGSPAIDAGDDSICATTVPAGVNNKDQRGVTRPVGAHCDIGAFESQGFTLTKTSGDNQHAVVGTAFTNPLVITVAPGAADAADHEPVTGGVVIFTAIPNGEASVTLTGSPATITGGQASVTATANTIVGSYGVTASAAGASSVTFSLTNTAAPLTSIAFTGPNGTPLPTTLKVGQMVQITATGTFSDGSTQNLTGQVQWSSSNPQIVTVDAAGNVTGKSPGMVTITATLNGVMQTITVTIGAPTPIGITVQPAPAARPGGATSAPGAPPPVPIPTGR